MSYAVIGTDSFTRIAPADRSIYNGILGSYNISWTRATGKNGSQGIKFEPTLKNFSNGASDVFTVVVSGFNASTTIQVEASSAKAKATFSFLLSQTACASSSLLSPATQPFAIFFDWLRPSWNELSWLLRAQVNTPLLESSDRGPCLQTATITYPPSRTMDPGTGITPNRQSPVDSYGSHRIKGPAIGGIRELLERPNEEASYYDNRSYG
jgi:hypothetical protein